MTAVSPYRTAQHLEYFEPDSFLKQKSLHESDNFFLIPATVPDNISFIIWVGNENSQLDAYLLMRLAFVGT